MFKRLSAVAVVTLIAVLTAVGIGAAAVPGATTTTSTSTPASTPTSAAPGGAETVIYQIADAGTITVGNSGSVLTVLSTDPTDGWTVEIETATGVEVEVDFRNGTRRVQFNAELENGQVEVRVRERAGDDTTTSTPSSSTTMPTTTSMPDTTTSIPIGGDSTTTYDAGDAGTVTVMSDGSTLTVLAAVPAQGWSAEIETASGIEVEVEFRNGTRRIKFSAELEDGAVKVRVRDRVTDDGTREDGQGNDHATVDDDTSGHGNDDDDGKTDDNSGHGNDDDGGNDDNDGGHHDDGGNDDNDN